MGNKIKSAGKSFDGLELKFIVLTKQVTISGFIVYQVGQNEILNVYFIAY